MEEQAVSVAESTVTTYYNIEMQYDQILPTPEFDPESAGHLRPKLIQANQYIDKLNNLIGENATLFNETRSRYWDNARKLEDILQENVDEIDADVIKAICEIYDIELKKTIKFSATVEVKGELEVDLWADEDDYFDDVQFSVDFEWGVDGSITDHDITEISER